MNGKFWVNGQIVDFMIETVIDKTVGNLCVAGNYYLLFYCLHSFLGVFMYFIICSCAIVKVIVNSKFYDFISMLTVAKFSTQNIFNLLF